MSNDRYQLIDFGAGRKLESLAGHLIDRPSPAAENARRSDPSRWHLADARYDPDARKWTHQRRWPEDLEIQCCGFRMPARPTPFGHIGLFPEQADNWKWLGEASVDQLDAPEALNLFAYTGASTIALARAGFGVAHVDAAKPSVESARTAAARNELGDAPIRYLVDDAMKFANREIRRGRRYHTIVMDPPAYGHAPGGKAWRIERDLWPLLGICFQLMDCRCFRLLVTGHSPQVNQSDVVDFLRQSDFIAGAEAASRLLLDSGRSQLEDAVGRTLDTGFYVRVESRSN